MYKRTRWGSGRFHRRRGWRSRWPLEENCRVLCDDIVHSFPPYVDVFSQKPCNVFCIIPVPACTAFRLLNRINDSIISSQVRKCHIEAIAPPAQESKGQLILL